MATETECETFNLFSIRPSNREDNCYSLPVEKNMEPMVPTLMFECVTEMLKTSRSTYAGMPEVVA
jgi:hypothetical protein